MMVVWLAVMKGEWKMTAMLAQLWQNEGWGVCWQQ
jgi:hypothetical protein